MECHIVKMLRENLYLRRNIFSIINMWLSYERVVWLTEQNKDDIMESILK